MSTDQNEEPIYWPRVKQILEDIMERWTTKWGRDAYPGIHEYYWETAKDLQESVLSGFRSIEPGVPGRETHLAGCHYEAHLLRKTRSKRLSGGSIQVCQKVQSSKRGSLTQENL